MIISLRKSIVTFIVIIFVIMCCCFLSRRIVSKSDSSKDYSVVNHYNNQGQILYEDYVDSEGMRVTNSFEVYMTYREYDEDGINFKVVFADENGHPMPCKYGYVSSTRDFENNRIMREMYYDSYGIPVMDIYGRYGCEFEYDLYGYRSTITALDQNQNPMIFSAGYATVRRILDSDGGVLSESYYDENDCPIPDRNGHYGYSIYNGKTIYLNKDGEIQLSVQNLINAFPLIVMIVGVVLCIIEFALPSKNKIAFLIVYLLFIVTMTLLRHRGSYSAFWIPFQTYKEFFEVYSTRMEILNNIWLFIPLGACLYDVYRKRRVVFIATLISVVIELIQFVFKLGVCEFDDVISNTLGAVIGVCFVVLLSRIRSAKESVK